MTGLETMAKLETTVGFDRLTGIDVEALLSPISGDSETGVHVRYLGDYTRIEEARRGDDPNQPRGVWQRSLKQADWGDVIAICQDVLQNRSKDLQVLVWMVDALVHRDGSGAIAPSLALLQQFCGRFWDGIHPEIEEDGDASARAAAIAWLDDKLSVAVMSEPLVGPMDLVGDGVTYSWTDYRQARHLEGLRTRDPAALKKAEESGTVTMSVFREAVETSSTEFYETLHLHLQSAGEAAKALETWLDERLGDEAPGFTRLGRAVEEVVGFMQPILATRVPPPAPEPEPEPAPEPPATVATAPTAAPAALASTPVASTPAPPGPAAQPRLAEGTLQTAEDAHEALLRIAAFLKTVDPHSPSPYLIEKAVEWGRMPLPEVLRDIVNNGYDFAGLMYLLGVPSGRD